MLEIKFRRRASCVQNSFDMLTPRTRVGEFCDFRRLLSRVTGRNFGGRLLLGRSSRLLRRIPPQGMSSALETGLPLSRPEKRGDPICFFLNFIYDMLSMGGRVVWHCSKTEAMPCKIQTTKGGTTMPHDFFRKERLEVTRTRLKSMTDSNTEPPTKWLVLKSDTIFEAKLGGKKARTVWATVDGDRIKTSTVLDGITVKVTYKHPKTGDNRTLRISEKNMYYLLTSKVESLDSFIKRLAREIAVSLCKAHTLSSSRSLFISGCVKNNFQSNTTYPGYKFHLELSERKPFPNPLCSGNEREYFLIGIVKDTDCDAIHFLGKTGENVDKPVYSAGTRP